MALKTQYFCKKSGLYVKPEISDSKAEGGLVLITGLGCDFFSSGFCKEYGGACPPCKKAKKDARYDNRKNAQTLPSATPKRQMPDFEPLDAEIRAMNPDKFPQPPRKRPSESPGMAAHNLLGDRGQYGMGNL